jgi:hypothetical protein
VQPQKDSDTARKNGAHNERYQQLNNRKTGLVPPGAVHAYALVYSKKQRLLKTLFLTLLGSPS